MTATEFAQISATEYHSVDGKWMITWGAGHPAGPRFPRVWSLHERTGEIVIEDGVQDEVLRTTQGSFFSAEEAMAAADWTEEQRTAEYRAAQAWTLKFVTALRFDSDQKRGVA